MSIQDRDPNLRDPSLRDPTLRDPNVYDSGVAPVRNDVRVRNQSTSWAWVIGGLIVLAAIFGFFFWDNDPNSDGPATGTIERGVSPTTPGAERAPGAPVINQTAPGAPSTPAAPANPQ